MKSYITENSKQTQKIGELLAQEILADRGASRKTGLPQSKGLKGIGLPGAFVICLDGDLGAGKTTFAQGLLKGLGAKGPYTSPTFLIMKEYKFFATSPRRGCKPPLRMGDMRINNIYHIDAYRVKARDILNLSWEEIKKNDNIVIIEWPERIKKIIPKNSLWLEFKWLGENKRQIIFKSK